MQITLSPELAKLVEEKVNSGQYPDANAVIANALEVFIEQEALTPEYEQYVRKELDRAVGQVERGEYADFTAESVIAERRALRDRDARREKR
jgi:Arc/MetJ-type ribon-helix-helix transcriptional regulator